MLVIQSPIGRTRLAEPHIRLTSTYASASAMMTPDAGHGARCPHLRLDGARHGHTWSSALPLPWPTAGSGRAASRATTCACANSPTRMGYWEAVRIWLENWNGRLFLALTQIGSYHLPWFSSPLQAPWFVLHAMIVVAHIWPSAVCSSACCRRAGIATGASLAAVLVFAIHPVTFEPVLWLAEGYGYVLGNLLTILAVWSYLEYERRSRLVWLIAAFLLALAATLGIEQYLFVLGALAIVHLLSSRWHTPRHPAWLPLLIVTSLCSRFPCYPLWIVFRHKRPPRPSHRGIRAGRRAGILLETGMVAEPASRCLALWRAPSSGVGNPERECFAGRSRSPLWRSATDGEWLRRALGGKAPGIRCPSGICGSRSREWQSFALRSCRFFLPGSTASPAGTSMLPCPVC